MNKNQKIKSLLLIISFFFLSQIANAVDYIEVYSAYTNGQRVLVEGRIIDKENQKTKESKTLSTLFMMKRKIAPLV